MVIIQVLGALLIHSNWLFKMVCLVKDQSLDTLAVCRKLVGHFKRSPLACHQLNEIQKSLSQPQHHLKQDVQTGWNSTLLMLQSIIEQKMVIGVHGVQHDSPFNTESVRPNSKSDISVKTN